MQHEMPPDGSPVYAGFWIRGVALALDLLLLYAAVFAVGAVTGLATAATWDDRDLAAIALGLGTLALLATLWLYLAGWHASPGQATPGKRIMGLRVVRWDGRPVGIGRATVRVVAMAFSVFPFLLGLVSAMLHGRKNALHDTPAGPHVVHRADFEHWSAAARLPRAVYAAPAPAVPPGRSLSDWVPPAPAFDDDRDAVRELGMSQVVARPR